LSYSIPEKKIPNNNELRCKHMAVEKTNSSSSLAEVIDRILDKGIVIDAWVRVSLVGIELLAVEARIVIASVETYLKYAEAVGLTQSAAVPA
jgi:hypothetical protein